MPDSQEAVPCGLVAKSIFNDTFKLFGPKGEVNISSKGIAWKSDVQYKFRNLYNKIPPSNPQKTWEDLQWHDME